MDTSRASSREQPIPLERWLRELQSLPSPPFLLGGTGHLILTPDEEQHVGSQLRSKVLPRVFEQAGDRELLVLTGLAPGADHLFSHIAISLLQQRRLRHRLIGLLPLPVDVMLDDWAEKARAQADFSESLYEAQRERILAEIEACHQLVHLLPPGITAETLHEERFRQLQYRRLAACLAEQSDALVAILRDSSGAAQPGGTAEVVNWRREPQRVPSEVTTLALRHYAPALRGALFVIAPDGASGHD